MTREQPPDAAGLLAALANDSARVLASLTAGSPPAPAHPADAAHRDTAPTDRATTPAGSFADVAAALAGLGDAVDALHRAMAPADVLELDLDGEVLAMGRHEVPALALLFRFHHATPEATVEARRRAEALVRSGRVVS
jgi:hypothetical protein